MGTRILQVANFYSRHSGGLRTTVDALGRGIRGAGFERVLVVPGAADADEDTPAGRRITLRGPMLPGSGGYRALPGTGGVRAVLAELPPDHLEVSDKLTLVGLGSWAARNGVRAVLVSHERLDAILSPRVPPGFPLGVCADWWNRRIARGFDAVVTPSRFAAAEFTRIGATDVSVVPLGVDLDVFHPPRSRATGGRGRATTRSGSCASAGSRGRSGRMWRSRRSGPCEHAAFPLGSGWSATGPAGSRSQSRRAACLSCSPGTCRIAASSPVSSPAPTPPSRPARTRRSGWPRWRRSRAAPPWWRPIAAPSPSSCRRDRARPPGQWPRPTPLRWRRRCTTSYAVSRIRRGGIARPRRAVPVGGAPRARCCGSTERHEPAHTPVAVLGRAELRRVFRATIALGHPVSLGADFDAALRPYERLCLEWYLRAGPRAGLRPARRRSRRRVRARMPRPRSLRALAAARRRPLHGAGRARACWRAGTRPRSGASTGCGSGTDGISGATPRTESAGLPHAHMNATTTGGLSGRLLADHVDAVVAAAGFESWYGEMNARTGRRVAALSRWGAEIVARRPNGTLSWLTGSPVERLTVLRHVSDRRIAA